ncbi:alpha-ketoglutarate catabolism dioxygenase [Pluteus cervinus]|uniref:Alpha-ketoglutarate catabolism dioxygenase n=1 Tax=Pluteus cervinus TaxID=181527 RepID=A0ACD3AZU9_9AGAR|nr:alpha-ketoglutarate catabolism dioxygenase [Pluteus cervinus]
MAPSVAELAAINNGADKVAAAKESLKQKEESQIVDAPQPGAAYPFYLPHFDVTEKFLPTEIFEHSDAGLRANPAKPNLLNSNTTLHHLSPYLGTEITGVQISQLSKEGLDELALYAGERKVLIFRDQDFKDIGPDRQIEIARHFGPIQKHPTSGNAKGYPEFHVVYRDATHDRFKEYLGDDRVNRTSWHSDVSYEKQPPSTTFFFILDQPDTGGDTLFLSQVEAYRRLSPEFQKRLEGLRAVHSAVAQADASRRRGGPVRREPVESEHPLVRVHPVTGEKALYINPGFTRRIVGFKHEESEYLLRFLYDHLTKGADFQIRASYRPGTVVVWDNRVTVHSAIVDFDSTFRRHAVRLTPQAEVPIPA